MWVLCWCPLGAEVRLAYPTIIYPVQICWESSDRCSTTREPQAFQNARILERKWLKNCSFSSSAGNCGSQVPLHGMTKHLVTESFWFVEWNFLQQWRSSLPHTDVHLRPSALVLCHVCLLALGGFMCGESCSVPGLGMGQVRQVAGKARAPFPKPVGKVGVG